ncbi:MULTISPECIES: LysR family transcriptional regulator [unclassified Caballeronia]|uniref:LysR family transcriptional regulator n=1 Tax=unclassified Caballeronia TaxID=2646786 RepID=UPI002858C182|nr:MULTISPECIES: LysR family transcriptional regulator [unclassified Caballeronia]MDR5813513.1 LysR family transcriptional regulator [Caballeronia sp. LZ033]MDR5820270.1 LysR family transcriptional regulator [Caballeronia sp. LZ043]MDR5833983.1 LysR family transcriptional regulator [Caballeronia sp. LZ034LL]MDR5878087.1 LysR family transcriptional regulator [Caballeronia sp. LZ032]
MDLLRSMRIFARVAEAASFTAAAQQMDITTAQASRAVTELETHLRTRLLNRTTRRVALTDAGNRYLARCKEVLELVDLSEAEASDAQVLPSGVLRMHAPITFGQHYVVPALTNYLEAHPQVRVELTLSQHVPDMLDEGFDVFLQVTTSTLPDSAFVSTKICSMPSVLCASPGYLKKAGAPRNPEDLPKHACLQMVTTVFPLDRWLFDGPRGRVEVDLEPGRLRVNSADALAVALSNGLGIAPLPMLAALPWLESGALVRVLPEWELQSMTIYAMYASRQYLDAKIRTWIAFLKEFVQGTLASEHA